MNAVLSEFDLYCKAIDLLTPNKAPSAFDWCSKQLHLRDGKWEARRAGIMKHWYDIASARITGNPIPGDPYAHLTEEIYLITITQIAKTTFLLSLLAWLQAHYPYEMGLYMSREKDYRRIKERSLKPMIEKSPALFDLLPESLEGRERALASSSISLAASLLHLLNGNIVEDLRGLPLTIAMADEIEQLTKDIAGQGSVIDMILGRQRTKIFDRLFIGTSSPVALNGYAWTGLCKGSHERPMVICEQCGCCDFLDMNNITIKSGIEDGKTLRDFPPEVILKEGLARWHCSNGCLHDANAVERMLQDCIIHSRWIAGKWAQTKDNPSGIWTPESEFDVNGCLMGIIPPETRVRSGWANAFYSSFTTLDGIAAAKVTKFEHGTLAAKKTWTNTEANMPWIHVFTPTNTDEIKSKACRGYAFNTCPIEPDLLFLVFDQQGNNPGQFWYPWVLRGFMYGGESYLIACGKAMNETERDEIEEQSWVVGDKQRGVDLTAIDVANGNYRPHGYLWASEDANNRVCLWGDNRMRPGETWAAVGEASENTKKRRRTSKPSNVNEWRLHPHYWRGELQERLLQKENAPAFHLPAAGQLPKYYLQSMTAEERVVQQRRIVGGGYEDAVVWMPRVTSQTDDTVNVRKDNHWADCEKMAIALAEILEVNVDTDTQRAPAKAPRAAAADLPAAIDDSDELSDYMDTW